MECSRLRMLSLQILLQFLWKPSLILFLKLLAYTVRETFAEAEERKPKGSTIARQSHDKMRENGPASAYTAVCCHKPANFHGPIDFYKI